MFWERRSWETREKEGGELVKEVEEGGVEIEMEEYWDDKASKPRVDKYKAALPFAER